MSIKEIFELKCEYEYEYEQMGMIFSPTITIAIINKILALTITIIKSYNQFIFVNI